MTPEERAEIVSKWAVKHFIGNIDLPDDEGECIRKLVLEHIREAVDEARTQLIDGYDDTLGIKRAKSEAYEDAAKIAEDYLMIGAAMNPQFPQLAKNLSEQIRARAK